MEGVKSMISAKLEIIFGCPRCENENKCEIDMYQDEHAVMIDIMACPHCGKKIKVEADIFIDFVATKVV